MYTNRHFNDVFQALSMLLLIVLTPTVESMKPVQSEPRIIVRSGSNKDVNQATTAITIHYTSVQRRGSEIVQLMRGLHIM
jgi:hypothetical protein